MGWIIVRHYIGNSRPRQPVESVCTCTVAKMSCGGEPLLWWHAFSSVKLSLFDLVITGLARSYDFVQHNQDSRLPHSEAGADSYPGDLVNFPLFRRVNVTDFRDKLHVALSLTIIAADFYVDADYSLDTIDVYKKVVKFFISSKDNLNILRLCQDSAQVSCPPSWGPDSSVGYAVATFGEWG